MRCIGLIPQAPLHTSSLVVMGYEDSEKSDDSISTAVSDGHNEDRPLRRSYPNVNPEEALEMRNLDIEEPSTYPSTAQRRLSRSRSPIDGLRRRLSRDPEVQKDRKREMEARNNQREIPIAVVEQRVSNLAQGCLCECQSRLN